MKCTLAAVESERRDRIGEARLGEEDEKSRKAVRPRPRMLQRRSMGMR